MKSTYIYAKSMINTIYALYNFDVIRYSDPYRNDSITVYTHSLKYTVYNLQFHHGKIQCIYLEIHQFLTGPGENKILRMYNNNIIIHLVHAYNMSLASLLI